MAVSLLQEEPRRGWPWGAHRLPSRASLAGGFGGLSGQRAEGMGGRPEGGGQALDSVELGVVSVPHGTALAGVVDGHGGGHSAGLHKDSRDREGSWGGQRD